MPVETAKCWWLLKIEPNAWAGGKGSCAVCIDLQAVGALEFFGELYSLRFWPIFEEALEKGFAVSAGMCGVACPLPTSRVNKPLLVVRGFEVFKSSWCRGSSLDSLEPGS